MFKLHGSLNWYWAHNDFVGSTIALRDLPGYFENPRPYDETLRHSDLPGRVPFIVPPAISKSDYFRIPFLRDIWRQAYQSLSAADEVIFAGYSMPLADQTTAHMIRLAFRNKTPKLRILDKHPDNVKANLLQLFGGKYLNLESSSGNETAIVDFVEAWAEEESTLVWESLSDANSEDRIGIFGPNDRFLEYLIVGINEDSDSKYLTLNLGLDSTGTGSNGWRVSDLLCQPNRKPIRVNIPKVGEKFVVRSKNSDDYDFPPDLHGRFILHCL